MDKELTQAQKYDILQHTLWYYVEQDQGLDITDGPDNQAVKIGGHSTTLGEIKTIWGRLLTIREIAKKEGR